MDIIGAAIATRAIMEGKPGVVNHDGSSTDVVERRVPDGRVLPQPARHPHRDDRQSDARAAAVPHAVCDRQHEQRFPSIPVIRE